MATVPITAFGAFIKQLRIASGKTLREFCAKHGFDPGNYSRLERGLFQAPHKNELLEKYATALRLKKGSDEWIEFFDLAAASRGEIPKDILSDEEVLGKLPLLFRTLRAKVVSSDNLDALVEAIRKG